MQTEASTQQEGSTGQRPKETHDEARAKRNEVLVGRNWDRKKRVAADQMSACSSECVSQRSHRLSSAHPNTCNAKPFLRSLDPLALLPPWDLRREGGGWVKKWGGWAGQNGAGSNYKRLDKSNQLQRSRAV